MINGTIEISHWAKVLATKLEKLTWISGTHSGEKNQLPKLSSECTHGMHMCIYTHTHIHTRQIKKKNYKKIICEFSNRITSLTETLCHIYVHLSIVWHTLSYVLFHILVF